MPVFQGLGGEVCGRHDVPRAWDDASHPHPDGSVDPGRDLERLDRRIPPVADEIDLIACYGARVLAVCVNDAVDPGVDFDAVLADLRASIEVPAWVRI